MKFDDKFPIDQALNLKELENLGYRFGLVYSYDSVQLKELKDIQLDKNTLIEARFFNKDKEIHIFKQDIFKAVAFIEDEMDESFEEEHLLIDGFGKKLRVKNYIAYDYENQAYIAYTRPVDVVL